MSTTDLVLGIACLVMMVAIGLMLYATEWWEVTFAIFILLVGLVLAIFAGAQWIELWLGEPGF